MTGRSVVAPWIARWDRQQEHYADARDARFEATLALLRPVLAGHDDPVLVDLGAGPGSLSLRLAEALPTARVLAVESDPFLVALGSVWCGPRVAYVARHAGATDWRTGLPETVHAVVAASALHYPTRDALATLYADLHSWLAPGGVLVNADHFSDLGAPPAGTDDGPGPWSGWWRQALAAPELADLPRPDPEGGGDNHLTSADHVGLLRAAGFAAAHVAWWHARSGLVTAAR